GGGNVALTSGATLSGDARTINLGTGATVGSPVATAVNVGNDSVGTVKLGTGGSRLDADALSLNLGTLATSGTITLGRTGQSVEVNSALNANSGATVAGLLAAKNGVTIDGAGLPGGT